MMSENAAVDLFFNLVSKRSESTGFKSCPNLYLPQTVVYTATVPSGWFACTSEGDMITREGNKVKPAKVYEAFLDEEVAPLQSITSTLISVHEQEAKVAYLAQDDLRDFLFRQSKPALGVLQRWHGSPVGFTRNFRVDYSPDLMQMEMRTNLFYKSEYQAQSEPISSDLTRKSLKQTVRAICEHIATTSQLQVARMVLHFSQDQTNRLWLQFCSCLRLRAPSGVFIGQPRPFHFALFTPTLTFIGICANCHNSVQHKLYSLPSSLLRRTTTSNGIVSKASNGIASKGEASAVCDECYISITSMGSKGVSKASVTRSVIEGSLSRASSVQGGLDKWLRQKAGAIRELIKVDVFALVRESADLIGGMVMETGRTGELPEGLAAAAEAFTTERRAQTAAKEAGQRRKREEARIRSKLASMGLKLAIGENRKFEKLSLEDELAAIEAETKRKELGRLTTSRTSSAKVTTEEARPPSQSTVAGRLVRTRRVLGLDQRRACFDH